MLPLLTTNQSSVSISLQLMNLSLRMDKAPMGKPKGQQHLEFVKAVIAATCKVPSSLPSGQIRCCLGFLQHAGTQFGGALATSGSSSEYQLWRYLQGSCEVTQVDDKRKAGSQPADCRQRLVSQKKKT